jgi:hypothetical protein
MNRETDQEFSRELLQAISAEEAGCVFDMPALTGNDLAVLKQILRGERIPRTPVDKKRVVNALARSESSAEASDILARIVSNTSETKRVRATAASSLSLMPPDAAEKALLQNLTVNDEAVRAKVFKSLGRVGTAESLGRLNALPEPANHYARKQMFLAKLAITYRSGSEARNAEFAKSALGISWTTEAAKAVEGKRVRENIDAILDSTYGLGLNPDIGYEIVCGRNKLFLFLNDAIKRGAFAESLRSRNMIAGLVARQEGEARFFSTRYLVLTSPSAEGVEVIVARTNGDVAYAGEARIDGDALQLNMRDVGLERIPMEIEGRVSNADIRLGLNAWRGESRPKKQSVPIR